MQTKFQIQLLSLFIFTFVFISANFSNAQNNPTIGTIADVYLAESSSPAQKTVNIIKITDGGDGGQTISITAISNNNSLIPNPITVNYTSPESKGSLAFTPTADAYGQATIAVIVNDGVDTPVSTTFTIYVNGKPTFDSPSSVSFKENATGAVIDVNTTDPEGDVVSFSLKGEDSDDLLIDGNGVITFINSPNFEAPTDWNTDDIYNVTVIATDNGNPNASSSQAITITVTNVNEAPVIVASQMFSIDENSPAGTSVGTVVASDIDVPTTLTYYIIKGNDADMFAISPLTGAITAKSGQIDYETTAQYILGVLVVDDGNPILSDDEIVTININNVNEAPVFSSIDEITVEENQTDVLTVVATDPETTPVTYSLEAKVMDNDLFTINSTSGALSFNTPPDFENPLDANSDNKYFVTVTASDSNPIPLSESQTISVTVSNINESPIAVSDVYNVNEDDTLQVDIPGVLINDTDPENNSLTSHVKVNVTHGNLVFNSNGSFTYIPQANYNGVDQFSYCVNDGNSNSSDATVTINIQPQNDAPVAYPNSYSVLEDEILTINSPGVLDNDIDIDYNSLTANLVSTTSNGILHLYPDGSFTYQPAHNFAGIDTFSYAASDGSLPSNTVTVTIDVGATNDPPVSLDDNYVVDEDNTLSVVLPGILNNDSDSDNNSLSVFLISNVSHGTLNLEPNGSFTYTPVSNYYGNDSFTYKASDGQVQGNTATVSITISAVNDYPIAVNDYLYTAEDIPDNINVTSNDNDSNDSQNGGIDETSISIISQSKHGTAFIIGNKINYTPYSRFYGNDTLVYTIFDSGYPLPPLSDTAFVFIQVARRHPLANDDNVHTDEDTPATINVLLNDKDIDINPSTVTIGTPPNRGTTTVNSSTGNVTYTPNLNYNGLDVFTYTVQDMTGLISNIANVIIDIQPVPDNPVTINKISTTPENMPVTIQLDEVASDPDNDIDTTSVEFVTIPTNGVVATNSLGEITYTPNPGFSGIDIFTFKVSDYKGNISNTSIDSVTVSNEAPNAINDTIKIFEDQISEIDVLANDTDPQGDHSNPQGNIIRSSVRVVTSPLHGITTVNSTTGVITYTPELNYFGSDIFTYSVADVTNYSDEALVSITIKPINNPPVAVNDTIKSQEDQIISINLFENDYDIDNLIDSSKIIIPSPPNHGQVSFDATTHLLTYTPEPDYFGNDSLTYQVFDEDGASSEGSVFITLSPIPDAPKPIEDLITTNEEIEISINVVLNDVDIENDIDTCSLSIISDPLHGVVRVLSEPNCGHIIYNPDTNYLGTDQFIYQISDTSGLSGQTTVYITINNTPDAPIANDDLYTTPEDSTLIMNVLLNDYDPDNNIDSTQLSILDTPKNGTLEITNNRIIYVPASNFNGTDQFKYQVCDSTNIHDSAYVYINITPVNDAPVAVDDYGTTMPGQQAIKVDITKNDYDVDSNIDTTSIIVITQPLHGTARKEKETRYIIYIPDADYYGTDSYNYRICDTHDACDTATVFLEITSGNVAPVTQPDLEETDEDTPVTILPAKNDTDPNENLKLSTLSIVTNPLNGTASLDVLRSTIIYTPNLNFNGNDTITYSICDNEGLCSSEKIYITIHPINDSPVPAQRNIQSYDNSTTDIDVLSYCSDPENDPLTVSISESSPVINGIATVNEDGTIRYESAKGIYCTSEQVIYKVCDDSGLCAIAKIYITLVPTDSDGDNIPDDVEGDGDSDNDGTPNYLDNDSDGDGISDSIEGAIADPCSDVLPDNDGDSTPDYLDTDSDNDGLPDIDEGGDDCDNDGIPDYQDMEDDCVERLDVPDTFSPNGDGVNDFFKIPGANDLSGDKLYIYNRWGGLIYQSNNYDNTWDGRSINGLMGSDKLPEGTYFYIYKPDETMQVFKGTVYLKR